MPASSAAANCHPHTLQYTPNETNIDAMVLIFVRPRRNNFPFVAIATRTNLNFQSRRPATPNGPRNFAQVLPGGGPLRISSTVLPSCAAVSDSMREATLSYWREPAGRSARASRHFAIAVP